MLNHETKLMSTILRLIWTTYYMENFTF